MRDGFVFYRSFYEASKPLNNDDKLSLYEAIFEFALNQNETKREPMVNSMFMLIKPQLEANNKRYENGKNGGRPPKEKTETKPKHNQSITETKPKDKDKEKEKEKDKDKEEQYPLWLNVEVWKEWVVFRKEKKSTLQSSTIKKQWLFLEKHKYDHEDIINQSIKNGWTGLFEIKRDYKPQNKIKLPSEFIKERMEQNNFIDAEVENGRD